LFLTGLERKTALLQAGTFKNTLRLIPVPHQICKSTFFQNILAKTTIFLLLAKLPILAEAIRQSGLFRTLFQIDSAAAAARVCKTRAGLLETSSRLARRAGRRSFIASLPHSFVRSFFRSFVRSDFRFVSPIFNSAAAAAAKARLQLRLSTFIYLSRPYGGWTTFSLFRTVCVLGIKRELRVKGEERELH
jgi:hypothetical protein